MLMIQDGIEVLWTWMIAHSDIKYATETAFITQSDLRF